LQAKIPYYTEINDFLETLPHPGRTTNPLFYCRRLDQLQAGTTVYRPPFKRDFYFFALFVDAGNVRIQYDDKVVTNPQSYLVCHSPGLVYSFTHDHTLKGHVIYFKKDAFSFFKPDFYKTFPFFNALHTNLYKMDMPVAEKLAPHFEEVIKAYERNAQDHHMEALARLLSLLYNLKEIVTGWSAGARFVNPQQLLHSKYIQLVNNHYIDKRTVKEYADLLAVTPNHLSQTVKAVTGKNALAFIVERVIAESKSLILYTDFDISEIAYQLDFSNPANFGKLFKKEVGMTPLEFRRRRTVK
jgi:AraC family transcriptional regulator, transcriptional activator of pobA